MTTTTTTTRTDLIARHLAAQLDRDRLRAAAARKDREAAQAHTQLAAAERNVASLLAQIQATYGVEG